MPGMHLKQLGFICSACGPFTKGKIKRTQKIKKKKKTGDSQYIYPNKLDTACFQNDKAYGDFKEILLEQQHLIEYCEIKHLILLKNQNMIDIKEVFASIV